MLSASSKKSFLVAMFIAGPATLFAFAAGSSAGEETWAHPLVSHKKVVFYEEFTRLDKAVYWTATAVAPDVANRAQLGHCVPAAAFVSQVEIEAILQSRSAAISYAVWGFVAWSRK